MRAEFSLSQRGRYTSRSCWGKEGSEGIDSDHLWPNCRGNINPAAVGWAGSPVRRTGRVTVSVAAQRHNTTFYRERLQIFYSAIYHRPIDDSTEQDQLLVTEPARPFTDQNRIAPTSKLLHCGQERRRAPPACNDSNGFPGPSESLARKAEWVPSVRYLSKQWQYH